MEGRSMGRLQVFTSSPAAFFERGFEEIHQTRMKGLPMVNPKIRVRAVPFRRWQNDWIGTLALPWAIVAVYVCGNRASWEDAPRRVLELPCGDFEFQRIDDAVLGVYYLLSLKSPVLDVEDQKTADIMAQVCLDTLLKPSQLPPVENQLEVPETPQGSLRRVIPIRAAAPQPSSDEPTLTDAARAAMQAREEAEAPAESFFERPLTRRGVLSGLQKTPAPAAASEDAGETQ